MGINTGGDGLPSKFPRRNIRINPTRGFRFPAPYNAEKGHNEPLREETFGLISVLVTAVFADYVAGIRLDRDQQHTARTYQQGYLDTMSEGAVYVAKPRWFQQSVWNGQTVNLGGVIVTYTYTGMDTREASCVYQGEPWTEVQRIVPPYFQNDLLTVHTVQTGLVDPTGKAIELEDLNTAGRVWAARRPEASE
ncbi:MAG: hypothetical protein AAF745_00175 [Planctomycetota bacterium]